MLHPELALFFFLIALFYSAAGFGGGSSYLAVLALYGLEFRFLRMVALWCNITVVSGNILVFLKKGLIPWKKVWPMVLASVPMAYLGGRFPIEEQAFFILLGGTLFFAGVLMLTQREIPGREDKEMRKGSAGLVLFHAALGGGIGFLSGLVGIGGGIFLAPVLHLMRWAESRVIAATSSVFILVNSIAGIFGQLQQGGVVWHWQELMVLVVSVFLGGQAGSRLTAYKFSASRVRIITAVLILMVAARVLWKYLS